MRQIRSKDSPISASAKATIRRRLLSWFGSNHRELPWRKKVTPYSIWVSEVMLQQTVVKAVVPYYVRWMKRFPSIKSLSAASEQEVLRLWEGLGYYSRARNLHKAAKIVVSEHRGKVPDTYQELLTLPGVGTYTAAAIMSIAYGKPFPVLDANVRRVMSRFLGLGESDWKSDEIMINYLQLLIPSREPGRFNEALMELGQTVCINRVPLCEICPLNTACQTFARGEDVDINAKKTSQKVRLESTILLIRRGDKILLARKEEGVLSGLHVFPKLSRAIDNKQAAEVFLRSHLRGKYRHRGSLTQRVHTYTSHVEKLYPEVYDGSGELKTNRTKWKWVAIKELDQCAFPSVYRKVLADMLMQREMNGG